MARSWKTCSRRSASARRHGQDTADLTIVGVQRDLAGSLDPGDVVVQAGRPVLVVPSQVETLQLKLAMICWKDTREARRAITDALPLLSKVQEVVVVEVVEAESSRDAAHARVDDVISWLKRHDIAASARVFHCPMGEDQSYFSMAGMLLWRGHMDTRDCVSGRRRSQWRVTQSMVGRSVHDDADRNSRHDVFYV